MTAREIARRLLVDVKEEGKVLPYAAQVYWLDDFGVNYNNPSNTNPYPPSRKVPSHSSSSSPNFRHFNITPTALENSAYECGNPGGVVSRRTGNATLDLTLPPCKWEWSSLATQLDGISEYLRFVTDDGTNCASDSDCALQEKCGLSAKNLAVKNTQKTCGTLKGYWTADQICGVDPAFSEPFQCGILYQLYGCTGGISSCYSADATASCCGCANWWVELSLTANISKPYPTGTEPCVNANTIWREGVMPGLKPLKEMCPTMYTFPFDDKSSTFICNNGKGSTKPLDYFIIFCPDTNKPVGPISSVDDHDYRTIRFINKCPFEVWPAVAGGSVGHGASCPSNCVQGASCITTGSIQQCFWDNPTPKLTGTNTPGSYKLDAAGGTTTSVDFHLPIYANSFGVTWSGIMTGRTGCDTFPCATSDCGSSATDNGCTPGQGFLQPGVQAEFTFQPSEDYYDIEGINGLQGKWNSGTSALQGIGPEVYPDSDVV